MLFILSLDLSLKGFGLKLTLVLFLSRNSLVVETLPEDFVRLLSPDFLPLSLMLTSDQSQKCTRSATYLACLPFFRFLFESSQNDR